MESDIENKIDRIEEMVVNIYTPGDVERGKSMFNRQTVRKILIENINE